MHKQATIRPRNIVALLKIVLLAKDERDWGLLIGVVEFQIAILKEVILCGHVQQEKQKAHILLLHYTPRLYSSENDHNLYVALSACEMLRVGRVQEVNFARQWLKRFIAGDS